MAKRHKGNFDGKGDITRRSYLQLAGAAAAAATLSGVTATKAVAAQTDTVVDLSEKGLQNGDVIDGYLEKYVGDGVEVRIPEGEYDWKGSGFGGLQRNAAIIGEGEVILRNKAGSWRENIYARAGTVEIRNLTLRGITGPDKSRFRLEAVSGAKILIDNFNFPDGSMEGAHSRPFYSPPRHAGVVEIRNCYYKGFCNNGIYACPPGKDDGNGGQIIVENCVSHNNNIAGIRIGSDNSIVRNCLVLNDGPAPRNFRGQRNMRGIRIRQKGKNIRIENCEVIHSYSGAGAPIACAKGAEGSTGTIVNTKIRNDTSTSAMNFKLNSEKGWSTSNVSITGSGNLSYPSNFDNVVTGSGAEEPTGDDPQNGDGTQSNTQVLEVISTDSGEDLYYDLVVDGNVMRAWVSNKVKGGNNDEIVENGDGTVTVRGYTGNTYGDAYYIDGDVLSFEQTDGNSGYKFRLDGEDISLEDLVSVSSDEDTDSQDGTDVEEPTQDGEPTQDETDVEEPTQDDSDDSAGGSEELSNILILDGTASSEISKYRVVVTGEIERDSALSTVVDGGTPWDEIEDRVTDSAVTGLVAKGIDGYRFSGQLVSLQIDGRVDITLEQVE